jgi:hypothetical protein
MLYIYLDTSFLSQLTKVTGDSTKVFSHKEKWANLLNILRQGIKELKKVYCYALLHSFRLRKLCYLKTYFKDLSPFNSNCLRGTISKII